MTKKISESNIALRAKYRELITERFLVGDYNIFNSLTNEEKIKKYLTKDLQQYRRSSADSRDNSINFCFNIHYFNTSNTKYFSGFIYVRCYSNNSIWYWCSKSLTPTFKTFQHHIVRLVDTLPSYKFCEMIYLNAKKETF